MCVISEKRERLADEIIPVSAEHSQTKDSNKEKYAAAHAIDLDWITGSYTLAGSDGKKWLKVNLAKLYCIHQVIWYDSYGSPSLTWNCSSTDCSTCEGSSYYCGVFLLTTSCERASSDNLPLIADCKHGDTVKLELTNGKGFVVPDIAITGEIRYL